MPCVNSNGQNFVRTIDILDTLFLVKKRLLFSLLVEHQFHVAEFFSEAYTPLGGQEMPDIVSIPRDVAPYVQLALTRYKLNIIQVMFKDSVPSSQQTLRLHYSD